MGSIFLGLDAEDLFFHNQNPDSHAYIVEKPVESDFLEPISLRGEEPLGKEIAADGSIFCRGERFSLPLRPWVVPRLIPEGMRKNVGAQWLEAKTRSISSVIMGGGREERSYSDWISRRMGEEVYRLLYDAYIRKRFGFEGHELSAGLARILHFQNSKKKHFLYSAPKTAEEVRWESNIECFGVKNSKIDSVRINGTHHHIDGPLYVALPIHQILALLPEVPKTITVDASHLCYQDQGLMKVEGDFQKFSTYTHYLDPDHPWVLLYRVHERQALIWFCPSHEKEALQRAAAESLSLISQHYRTSWIPVWRAQSHFRYRRIATYLEKMGITLVGKRALYSHMSMPESVLLRMKHHELEISEFLRLYIEPPVRQDDLNASLFDWIVD